MNKAVMAFPPKLSVGKRLWLCTLLMATLTSPHFKSQAESPSVALQPPTAQNSSTLTYTVTFDPGINGQIVSGNSIQTVNSSDSAAAPTAESTNDAYIFDKWIGDFSNVTSDLTITAQYKLKTFTVQFDSGNLGTITSGYPLQTIQYKEAALEPTVTPRDPLVTFNGWNASFNEVTDNLTIKAVYNLDIPEAHKAPYLNDLYIQFDATYGVTENLSGQVLSWKNIATMTDHQCIGTSRPKKALRAIDNIPVIRFNLNSYFNIDDPAKPDTDVTAFICYNREDLSQVGVTWQRMFSILDPADSNSDKTGLGFNANPGQTKDYVKPIVKVLSHKQKSLKQISIGAHRRVNDKRYYNGDISEILIYEKALDDVELAAVKKYLYEKWISHEVTFAKGTSGEITSGETFQYIRHGEAAVAPVVEAHEGYTFTGWDKHVNNIKSVRTLTAQYKRKEFTVTFDAGTNGTISTGTAVQQVEYENDAVAPDVLPNAGYTFTGWHTTYNNVKSNLTVNALYAIKTFNVTFDLGSFGTLVTGDLNQTIEYDKDATAPQFTVNPAYTFTGWSAELTNVKSDQILTAQYDLKTFTVTFDEGSHGAITLPNDPQTIDYNNDALAPTVVPHVGYTFRGWDKPFTDVTSDRLVTALYDVQNFTVTFDLGAHATFDSGELLQTIAYGTSADAPVFTLKPGYTFEGWSASLDNITSNTTIVAQYKLKTFTVTFNAGTYGQFTSGDATQTIDYGTSASEPAVESTNIAYEFNGWNERFDNITGDLAVTAQFKIKTFTVTFDLGTNGTLTSGDLLQTVDYDTSATAPEITPNEAYIFSGWIETFDHVTSNIIIHAQYTLKTFTVTFVPGTKGQITAGDAVQTIDYGTAASAPTVESTDAAYEFSGWNVVFDEVKSDITATAEYAIKTFTVTFDAGINGTITSGNGIQVIDYGTAAATPTVEPVPGYTFDGWSGEYDSVTEAKTITALYTIKTFSVMFIAGDLGSITTGSSLQTVNYNDAAIAPVITTIDAYTIHTGWNVAFDAVVQNIVVSATYSQNYPTFTVTFDPGTLGTITAGDAVQTITYKQDAVEPTITPVDSLVNFTGWNTAFNEVTADITIEAQYSLNVPTANKAPYFNDVYMQFDATYGVEADADGNVSQWLDLATMKKHNIIGATLPVKAKRTIDDIPVVRFRSNAYLNVDNLTKEDTDITIFAAYSREDTSAIGTTWQRVFSSLDPVQQTLDKVGSGFFMSLGETKEFIRPKVHYATNTQRSLKQVSIGAHRRTADKRLINGDISEVLIYDRVLTTEEIAAVKKYLYSKWMSFPVTFNAGTNGTITAGQDLQYIRFAEAAVEPTVTPQAGYKFTGWDKHTRNVRSVRELTAQYEREMFTVTFDAGANGQIAPEDQTQAVEYGASAVAPTVTPETGYRFTGWNISLNNITANITIAARYELKTFTVTFDAGTDGTITSGDAVQTIQYGSDAVAPVAQPNDIAYKFDKWSTEFNNITGDLAVTAQYIIKSFTVTFDAGTDGTITSGDAVQTIQYGNGAVAPVAQPNNIAYKFDKWSTEFNAITGDLEVTAQYVIKSFTVTFDAGTTGIIASGDAVQTIQYGSDAVAPVAQPNDIAYKFDRWSTEFNNITGDLAVTAQYVIKSFTVTFEPGLHGTYLNGDLEQTIAYDAAAIAPNVTPETGYTFDGWDIAFDHVTSTLIVKALYSLKTFTVTFLAGDHGIITNNDSQTIAYGNSALEPAVTADQNYKHIGWSAKFDVITADLTVTALYEATFVTETTSLREGYNLVFLSVTTDDMTVNTILGTAQAQIEMLTDANGLDLLATGATSELAPYQGYLIKVKKGSGVVTLNTTGLPATAPASPILASGKNIIAIPGTGSFTAETFFGSSASTIEYIRNQDGQTMRRVGENWVSPFGELQAGKAYVVKVAQP